MTHTVFVDRDGTLCEDQVHGVDAAKLRLRPGAREAIALWKAAGWRVVMVTNQSGIGRGLYDEAAMRRFHDALADELGAPFDGVYHCPHLPDAGCACRKPKAGMMQRAAHEMGVDLSTSFVVGDSWRDVAAGQAAGCWTVQVPSRGDADAQEARESLGRVPTPDFVARDLAEAARWSLAQSPAAR